MLLPLIFKLFLYLCIFLLVYFSTIQYEYSKATMQWSRGRIPSSVAWDLSSALAKGKYFGSCKNFSCHYSSSLILCLPCANLMAYNIFLLSLAKTKTPLRNSERRKAHFSFHSVGTGCKRLLLESHTQK